MNILMLSPLREEESKKIEEQFQNDVFRYRNQATLAQVDIDCCDIIVGNPALTMNLNRENIKAILLNSAGSDRYSKAGLLHPNTILANASGSYGKAIAEHTIGMILTLNKHIKTYVQNMENHEWKQRLGGKEIVQSTVVIVGLGDLGYELAKRLKAFECYVIGIKRTKSQPLEYVDEIHTIDALDMVLPKADYVISALPQNKDTFHVFHKERFLRMKEDAMFVNIGRGSAVCTEDIVQVLQQNHLYGAAFDVVEEEPLPYTSPLWSMENVLITPHASGGFEWQSVRKYYVDLVIRNISHIKKKEPLENEVNFTTGYRKHTVRNDVKTCPYCGTSLLEGHVQTKGETIQWLPKEKCIPFFESRWGVQKGGHKLGAYSFLQGGDVKALCCGKCHKIIIDYEEK